MTLNSVWVIAHMRQMSWCLNVSAIKLTLPVTLDRLRYISRISKSLYSALFVLFIIGEGEFRSSEGNFSVKIILLVLKSRSDILIGSYISSLFSLVYGLILDASIWKLTYTWKFSTLPKLGQWLHWKFRKSFILVKNEKNLKIWEI